MSLDKAIAHHKEKRKPYRGAKKYFRSCRNHGEDAWCLSNRKHQERKERERIEYEE